MSYELAGVRVCVCVWFSCRSDDNISGRHLQPLNVNAFTFQLINHLHPLENETHKMYVWCVKERRYSPHRAKGCGGNVKLESTNVTNMYF